MAVGGATWDTAGLLDVGSSNTFDLADAAGGGDLVDEGFWAFTVAARQVVTITTPYPGLVNVRYGTSSVSAEVDYIEQNTGLTTDPGIAKFIAEPGIDYRAIVGTNSTTSLTTYVVTYALTPRGLVSTGWSDALRSITDNDLVVSAAESFQGELMDLNPSALNPRVLGSAPEWFYEVVETFANEVDSERVGPPARDGLYKFISSVSGPDTIDSDACSWSHAAVGDQHTSYIVWTETCPPLPANLSPATDDAPRTQPSFHLTYDPGISGGGGIPSSMIAEDIKVARGAWFLPVRDNLPPYGALDVSTEVDPAIDALLPTGYTGPHIVEYESPYADLIGVYVTGDRVDRTESDLYATRFHVNLDLDVLPEYAAGAWSTHWQIGKLGVEVPPSPPTRKARFTYNTGTSVSWNHLDAIVDWSDCAAWPTDSPDAIVGMEMNVLEEPPALDTAADGNTDVAFLFVLRAARFRVTYYLDIPYSPAPRRVIGRETDGLVGGGRRVIGGRSTRHGGKRTIGRTI